jgi:tetratricopeptide (TPR) repeat protein
MNPELGTTSPEALRSYLRGRDAFKTYGRTHRSSDLAKAKNHLAVAHAADPGFALAAFYLAILENESREHDAAITKLEVLVQRQVEFLPEALLHLAYAHTKKYLDADYELARRALDDAEREARRRRRDEFLPVVQAYRVFLYSVMGGRSKRPLAQRAALLQEAVRLGNQLLRDKSADQTPAPAAVRQEIHSALGIALMRQGQHEPDPHKAAVLWAMAEEHYERALAFSRTSTRVLDNRGTLRQIQGDRLESAGDHDAAAARYLEAEEFYRQALVINPRDQFRYYSIAKVLAKRRDWDAANDWYGRGIDEPGSVRPDLWKALRAAIDQRNPELLKKGET